MPGQTLISPAAAPTFDSWSIDGRNVRVLAPDAARGLEFDAVVVVEPSEFPKSFGRHGPLYTALTRANRELAIVHPSSFRRICVKLEGCASSCGLIQHQSRH